VFPVALRLFFESDIFFEPQRRKDREEFSRKNSVSSVPSAVIFFSPQMRKDREEF
jgi:hypothetical protein